MNRKMNYLHERALRLVYCDYESTFEDMLRKDRSLTFHQRNIHRVALEMYKVKNEPSPPFMKEIFKYIGDQSTRMGGKFARPNINSVKKGEYSLSSFGPIVWNTMLPEKLKNCDSLTDFKQSIKSWIPKDCPCHICKNYVRGLGYVEVFE